MKFKILCLFFVCLVSTVLHAQRENDTIKTEKLIIIKQYSPTLNDAFKVRKKPSISDSIKKPQRRVEYKIFSVPVASTFTPAKGTASAVSAQTRPYVFQNYARLGAGNFTNILAEFIGKVDINRYQNLSINLDHFSSGGGIETEILDNNFMDSGLDLKFESSERNFLWNLGLGLDTKRFNWYGVDEDRIDAFNQVFGDDIASIDPLQTYFGINLNGGIDFFSGLVKTLNLKVKNFTDAYNSSENEVDVNSRFQFYVSNNTLDLDAGFNFLSGNFEQQFNRPENGIKYSFLTTYLQPKMQFKIDNLILDVGIKGVFLSDTQNQNSDFFIYPKINAVYTLTEEFMLYAGLDGDLNSNSYNNIVDINPFVSPTLFLQPTDNAIIGFAGVNGKVNSLSYNVKAFYKLENNYVFFTENPAIEGFQSFSPVNNFEYSNSFGLLYDDLTTIGFSGEVNYEGFDDFNAGIAFEYYNFSLDNLPEASYLPELKVSLNANYKMSEKWNLSSTLFYIGERESLRYETGPADGILLNSTTVDGFVDINLGIDYQLNERIGLFVTGRNLLDNNYQQWRSFDVQGVQVMVGLSYQFDW